MLNQPFEVRCLDFHSCWFVVELSSRVVAHTMMDEPFQFGDAHDS
jgi:hypothetical protein